MPDVMYIHVCVHVYTLRHSGVLCTVCIDCDHLFIGYSGVYMLLIFLFHSLVYMYILCTYPRSNKLIICVVDCITYKIEIM